MLTPSFHISQTDEHLFLTVHAPYTQLNDVEINALGSEFWFYSSPYFLRLNFPCEVQDDDEPPTSFSADKGEFEIRLRKQVIGQHFPNLDLLGILLVPKKQKQNIKPSIEVLPDDSEDGEEEKEDIDEWLVEQELPSPEHHSLLNLPKYGFGNLSSGVFHQIKSEFKEIIDLAEPDCTSASHRDQLMRAEEDKHFSSDHYLADFMEPDMVEECIAYRPPWWSEAHETVKLTDEEKECLKKLGNKEFLLSKEEKVVAWLSMVDIVFAFAYNQRTTLGDNTVESAWTVNKLSATLSWFTNFTSPQSVFISCCRRSLVYPLYRNWNLSQAVLKDVIAIFRLGRRQLLKCLLEVHSLFAQSEPRYLLNQLYITDYCIWLQKTSDHKLSKFTDLLDQVIISKRDVGFELEELEQAALLVQQEEEEGLTRKMENLNMNPQDCSSEDSSADSESSGESCDSDDDSSPDS